MTRSRVTGLVGATLGVWVAWMVPGSAQEFDSCSEYWIPPGSTQRQCLNIYRDGPSPANTPATSGTLPPPPPTPDVGTAPVPGVEPAVPPAVAADSPEAGDEGAPPRETDWVFITQQRDGVDFFLDELSVTEGKTADERIFTYREDTRKASRRQYAYVDLIRTTAASCSLNTYLHLETTLIEPDGKVLKPTRTLSGVLGEDANPALYDVLRAACALDLSATPEVE